MTDPTLLLKKRLHPSPPPATVTYTPPGAKPGQKPVTVKIKKSKPKPKPKKSAGEKLQERLMPKASVKESYLSEQQFRKETGAAIPYSKYGKYDVIKKRITVLPSIPGLPQKAGIEYEFSYSPVAKHKIETAGSIENYNQYLDMVRKNSVGLMAAYSIHGGKGVGPFGLIPSMGWDVALQSNKPTATGASAREETLIKFLHEVKGSPKARPSLAGELKFIATDVPVQFAVSEAAFELAPIIFRAGMKTTERVAGRILTKMPKARPAFTTAFKKAAYTTTKLGGASKRSVLETNIYRNFSRWLHEGAKPATETTYKAISGPISKKLGGTKQTWRGVFHNVGHEWNVNLYQLTLKYKPVRKYGFAERSFIQPEILKKEADLLKQGLQRNFSVMVRGEGGKYPWRQINIVASKSRYRLTPFLRNVKHFYGSVSFESRTSIYPTYRPPPPEIGGIGPEFTKMTELKGFLSIAKKTTSTEMKNIWAGKKWNPLKGIWENQKAYATIMRQPASVSIEEQVTPQILRHVGEVSGKGISKKLPSVVMIPVERGVFTTTIPTTLLFRSLISEHKQKIHRFSFPTASSRKEIIHAVAPIELEPQISSKIQTTARISKTESAYAPPPASFESGADFSHGVTPSFPSRHFGSASTPFPYFYKKEMYGRGRKGYGFAFYGKKYKYRERKIFDPFKGLNLKIGKMVM